MSRRPPVQPGSFFPLGATWDGRGVNFALFSANAEKVELCVFNSTGDRELERIALPQQTNHVWHGYVPELAPGVLYGYRVYGPYEPHLGHRFNHHKLLLDPYARQIHGRFRQTKALLGYNENDPEKDLSFSLVDSAADVPKCVVVAAHDAPAPVKRPLVSWSDTIIYETHVRGFTINHPDVPQSMRGTFAGMAQQEVIAYLKALGITSVELLPVQGFMSESFLLNRELSNYWGYNSLTFFAPEPRYSSTAGNTEFRDMVSRFHDAGLEVILDVVYNHTAEGNQLGPTLSFRGIDNAAYYRLMPHEPRFYINDTGCGNTLNITHPRVLQMVLDSLRFWVTEMGVDGFRFDLATVLGREPHGFDRGSGFFDALTQDPVLSTVKLIAEPWDIGPGGYQLGQYPCGWAEWNDRYRDITRRYWRGDEGLLPEMVRNIHGSNDLFHQAGRRPWASVNFVTAHDGFTLNDLVSYEDKHNEANGEQNRDGHSDNHSANYGVEGPTDDPEILALRFRQQRNLLATALLSQGTPMLLAGDESGHSQNGNNNAYCQDNDTTWIDWASENPQREHLREFVSRLIRLRKRNPLLRWPDHLHGDCENSNARIMWVNTKGLEIPREQWQDRGVRGFGCLLSGRVQSDAGEEVIHLLIYFNASMHDVSFDFPDLGDAVTWLKRIDTAFDSGVSPDTQVTSARIVVTARSLVVLESSQ